MSFNLVWQKYFFEEIKIYLYEHNFISFKCKIGLFRRPHKAHAAALIFLPGFSDTSSALMIAPMKMTGRNTYNKISLP
jgi:hypothetical protein